MLREYSEATDVGSQVSGLLHKLPAVGQLLRNVADIEDAYIDVFVVPTNEETQQGEYSFELNSLGLEGLVQLGLPIRFTIVRR